MSYLAQLAFRYGTDKGRDPVSCTHDGHNYTDVYEGFLSGLRSSCTRILEVGIGVVGPHKRVDIAVGKNAEGGASLKMWADYFPNAEIIGVDINSAEHLDSDRIKTIQADQGRREDLQDLERQLGPQSCDVIIDDGSHIAHHQQLTFGYLFRCLRPEGLYFIEDLLDKGHSSIRSTRDVFRQFSETGRFESENARVIPKLAELEAEIGAVSFHMPEVQQSYHFRPFRREAWLETPLGWVRGRRSFVRDSETLLAIRRRGEP